ncbi:hypothetical protein EK21DRAFT_107160 [Setomelanomma holmii]|uniref:Uncharacterized protein n=1 Tax=Setomelanomma holmii TaxID=210430 RepID=A0A9P4LQ02_9PLEO|nr:hypothetical protein EK21DRAFT_107160 [Setomelanomma holmii]
MENPASTKTNTPITLPESMFDRLPTEVKLLVFEASHRVGLKRSVTMAMRVSKEWYDLAAPWVWEYTHVDNENVFDFIRSMKQARPVVGTLIYNLTATLSPDEKFLPLDVVASMLDALPPSCLQLELRTGNHDSNGRRAVDFDSKEQMNAMCEALRMTLPRLRHLYLEGMTISPFVFTSLLQGPNLPNMTSLGLNITCMKLIDRRYQGYLHLGPPFALEEAEDGTGPEHSTENWLRLQNLLAQELRMAIETGRFPSIKQLYVIDVQQYGVTTEDEWRLNRVDVLKGIIEVTPINSIKIEQTAIVDSGGSWSEVVFEAWAVASRISKGLKLFDENQYDELMVGAWISSTSGVRIASSEQLDGCHIKHDFEWVDAFESAPSRDSFLRKIKDELPEERAEAVEAAISLLDPSALEAYVIEGLLEWYD